MDKEDNTYKVYDYFKEHPGVLFTIISAILAIGSFVISLLLYLINYRYYKYWNIYPDIALEGGGGRYLISISVMLIVFEIVYIVCLDSVLKPFSDGVRKIRKLNAVKILLEEKTNAYKQKTKDAAKWEKIMKELRVEKSEMKELLSDEEKKDNDIPEVKEMLRNTKKMLFTIYMQLLWFCMKQGIKNLFVPFVCLQMIMTGLWITFRNLEGHTFVLMLLPLILTVIYLSLELLLIHLEEGIIKKDDFNIDNEESWHELVNLAKELSVIEYPNDRLRKHGIRSILSDQMLKKQGFNILNSICISTFVMFLVLMTTTRKIYAVVEHNGKDYAIVYQNLEHSVLEPAVIEADTLRIDASRQVILDSKELDFEIREFQKVIKIEEINEETENLT